MEHSGRAAKIAHRQPQTPRATHVPECSPKRVPGGRLFDFHSRERGAYEFGPFEFDVYGSFFWIGWVTRTLGVLLLIRIIEPGAWRWREILAGR